MSIRQHEWLEEQRVHQRERKPSSQLTRRPSVQTKMRTFHAPLLLWPLLGVQHVQKASLDFSFVPHPLSVYVIIFTIVVWQSSILNGSTFFAFNLDSQLSVHVCKTINLRLAPKMTCISLAIIIAYCATFVEFFYPLNNQRKCRDCMLMWYSLGLVHKTTIDN